MVPHLQTIATKSRVKILHYDSDLKKKYIYFFYHCSSLSEGETGGGGDDATELVPDGLGHVLGHERVLGLDVGEGSVGHLAAASAYLSEKYILF